MYNFSSFERFLTKNFVYEKFRKGKDEMTPALAGTLFPLYNNLLCNNHKYPLVGKNGFYLTSNERMAKVFQYFEKQKFKTHKNTSRLCQTNEIKSAFVIGESNVISLLPYFRKIDIDVVICNDIDIVMHENIKFMLHCLLENNSIGKFMGSYANKTNPLYGKNARPNPNIVNINPRYFNFPEELNEQTLKTFIMENKADIFAGRFHFLSSKKQYNEARMAAKNIKFVYTQVNICNERTVSLFSQALNIYNCKLLFVNSSNVSDYFKNDKNQKKFEEVISPLLSDCVFYLYSSNKYKLQTKLKLIYKNEKRILFNMPYKHRLFYHTRLPQKNKISPDVVFNFNKSI